MKLLSQLQALKEDDILDTRLFSHREGGHGAETEDYSLRRVPASWRWSAWQALWSFSGLNTAMVFPLMAGLLATFYGGTATLIAFLMTLAYTWLGVFYFARKAANEGAMEILMSKQSFGFVGASYQLIVYGLLASVYFALEGHVMASSLSELSGWPTAVSAAIICIAFIPLSVYGMKFLTLFQGATVWLYLIGILLVLYFIMDNVNPEVTAANLEAAWWTVNPSGAPVTWVNILSAFGVISGVLGAIMLLLCTEQARFARRNERNKAALLFSGLGMTVCMILTPLLGLYLLAASGGKIPDPGVSITKLLGGFGLALIFLTQLRINVINVYFGTNALENFSAVALKANWRRVTYIIPFLVICYLLIVSPWLQYFSAIMTMLSVFLVNWANVMLGEFWLVRRRMRMPAWSEFRRAYLPAYNRIGLTSMWIPTAIGVVMASGGFGAEAVALAVPVTGLLAFFFPLLMSLCMSDESVLRQYFARAPVSTKELEVMHICPIERTAHHRTDFVLCPHHDNQFISSTACASEKHCGARCQSLEQDQTATSPGQAWA